MILDPVFGKVLSFDDWFAVHNPNPGQRESVEHREWRRRRDEYINAFGNIPEPILIAAIGPEPN